MSKKIIVIAGSNGVGKTTFAREFLPNEASCPAFVNADLIAAGLSPFSPESVSIHAGKLMLTMIDSLAANGKSFAFETTLSGKGYARKISLWRKQGYHVKLIFLQLPEVDIAVARVAERVSQGGHNIPEDVIRRRYNAGIQNFHYRYKSLVDSWYHFDNSGKSPVLIDWSEHEP